MFHARRRTVFLVSRRPPIWVQTRRTCGFPGSGFWDYLMHQPTASNDGLPWLPALGLSIDAIHTALGLDSSLRFLEPVIPGSANGSSVLETPMLRPGPDGRSPSCAMEAGRTRPARQYLHLPAAVLRSRFRDLSAHGLFGIAFRRCLSNCALAGLTIPRPAAYWGNDAYALRRGPRAERTPV